VDGKIRRLLKELDRRSKELKISGVAVTGAGKVVVFVSERGAEQAVRSVGEKYGVDVEVHTAEVRLL
jgi:uncharacterized hydantoinase/oxoprolinase family protein